MNYTIINNNQTIPLSSIPVLDYLTFMEVNGLTLMKDTTNHCVNYFGFKYNNKIKLISCIANDAEHIIYLSSSVIDTSKKFPSITELNLSYEKFEREIAENFGIRYIDHPWLKPVRYSSDRTDRSNTIASYPFYKTEEEELHTVGVGPIHAGVIEPGHFRFICNGEQIMHLEIQLGYQHRGIENLMIQKKKLIQRHLLAESIAGDTVVAHTTAYANLWESLSAQSTKLEAQSTNLNFQRTLALELERMAIHTGDLSAICTDIAYQLGSSVFGRLRTPLINFFQIWCGNRLAKGLIRAGDVRYPFTTEHAGQLLDVLNKYEPDFEEMVNVLCNLPSALARFEKTGVVTQEQAKAIGTVGMAARMCGINRDIRLSHPNNLYNILEHQPILKHHGDVYSRVQIRRDEIRQSIQYIRKLIENGEWKIENKLNLNYLKSDSFALSLVEGWRGEICHCAITNFKGDLLHYKIKDPSFHNWLALALAVRNNEISDFPVCNKSFNLSYCGNDL